MASAGGLRPFRTCKGLVKQSRRYFYACRDRHVRPQGSVSGRCIGNTHLVGPCGVPHICIPAKLICSRRAGEIRIRRITGSCRGVPARLPRRDPSHRLSLKFKLGSLERVRTAGHPMYTNFRRLENGDVIHIASRESLEDAFQLIARIRSLWSEEAEYVVRDAEGKQMFPTGQSVM